MDPLPLLNWLCDQSPTFAEVFFYLLERHPCSVANPWSIVAYVDEAVPGNMLNLDHTRKAHCWYWSFEEFGPELLCREENWFIGGILRSSVVSDDLRGGGSCMFKHWVKRFFETGVDFAVGVSVHGARGPAFVVARLSTVLADEAAQKDIWGVKGSSGVKPCLNCINVVLKKRKQRLDAGFVTVECEDLSKLILHSDERRWEAADSVTKSYHTLGKTAFQKEQRKQGVTYNPDGILFDKKLREHAKPISTSVNEWCHVFLVGGIAQTELWLFLEHA